MRKKNHSWLFIPVVIVVIIGIIFMPPKDFIISKNKLEMYNGGEKEVLVPRSVTIIGKKSFASTIVETIIIPSTVRKIESRAFEYSKIEKFIIKEGVEDVAIDAFYNTKPTDILLPSSIKTKIDLNKLDKNKKVRLHLVKNSYIDKYLKENKLDINYEIKYDYKEIIKKYA